MAVNLSLSRLEKLSVQDKVVKFFLTAINFCYGYLFGLFMWYILVHPYTRFYDFEKYGQWAELVFALIISVLFMTFPSVRTVMLLFLPSMIGSASQNYIILLLFVALFSNPLGSVAHNAMETGRVIGCSITMTFEQLQERAKLLLNPVIEIFRDADRTDLGSIKRDLGEITDLVVNLTDEARFGTEESRIPLDLSSLNVTKLPNTDFTQLKDDFKERFNINTDSAEEILNRTRQIFKNVSLNLANQTAGVTVDLDELRRVKLLNRLTPLNQFNLSQIMYENCLNMFSQTIVSCERAVEAIQASCEHQIGDFLSFIFCSPITYSLKSACPWLLNQYGSDDSLCSGLRNYSSTLRIDPYNLTGNRDINSVYAELTKELTSLDEDLSSPGLLHNKRLELNIGLNTQTRAIFMQANSFIHFLYERYSFRQFYFDVLTFVYELYTSLTFVLIMSQAYHYRRSYLTQIRFDNYYITNKFKKLDETRRATGRSSVLPLTKDESSKYISTLSCRRRTREEQQTQKASCILLVVFMLFVLSLLYLDDIFYSLLDSMRQHAQISYEQMGHHELRIAVKGEGPVAEIVRSLTNRLNSVYDLMRHTDTKRCLPSPNRTSGAFYLHFTALVLAYTCIDQISIYCMRFRSRTAACFYPEKERQRILFLHRLILMQRQAAESVATKQPVSGGEFIHEPPEATFSVRDAVAYIGKCMSVSVCCASRRGRHTEKANSISAPRTIKR